MGYDGMGCIAPNFALPNALTYRDIPRYIGNAGVGGNWTLETDGYDFSADYMDLVRNGLATWRKHLSLLSYIVVCVSNRLNNFCLVNRWHELFFSPATSSK